MPLKTLQGLLVISAILWAIFPFYAAPVFLAFDLLLWLTTASKSRAARKYVDASSEQLEKTMSPEARGWVREYALHFVWPEESKAYGQTLKMTGLMMGFVVVWWVIYAVIRWNFLILTMIVPAIAVFFVGVTAGGKLEPDELVNESSYKDKKPLHEEAVKVLALLSTAGRWAPPAPS
jgi:hypothetical protein